MNQDTQLFSERAEILALVDDISIKYKEVKSSVSSLYHSFNKKEILLKTKYMDDSEKSMLKYECSLAKRELERAIHTKELLNKDLTLLQHRLKRIENELKQNKSFWQRFFSFM